MNQSPITEKIKGVAYLVFDISGSSDTKTEAYKKIYDKYNNEYRKVVLIGHSTSAKIYNTFEKLVESTSGGTYMSSGLSVALVDLLLKDKNDNNIVVLAGDGDNWSEDNEKTIRAVREINKIAKFIYYEVYPITYASTMYYWLDTKLKDLNLELHKIKNKDQLNELFKDEEKGFKLHCKFKKTPFEKLNEEINGESEYIKDMQRNYIFGFANALSTFSECFDSNSDDFKFSKKEIIEMIETLVKSDKRLEEYYIKLQEK